MKKGQWKPGKSGGKLPKGAAVTRAAAEEALDIIRDGARELQGQRFMLRLTLHKWREIMRSPTPTKILRFTEWLALQATAGVDRDDLERLNALTGLVLTEKQRARLAGRARDSATA